MQYESLSDAAALRFHLRHSTLSSELYCMMSMRCVCSAAGQPIAIRRLLTFLSSPFPFVLVVTPLPSVLALSQASSTSTQTLDQVNGRVSANVVLCGQVSREHD